MTGDPALAAAKAAARSAGFVRRKAAFDAAPVDAARHLLAALAAHSGTPLAGYMPMRTEIDPRPAMAMAAQNGPVAVPVIIANGQPLRFRQWQPGCALVAGAFGAQVPAEGVWIVPQIVIVPLVAFTRSGGRLGYGGGFYDRTLQELRAVRPTLAIGYAFAAQEAQGLPLEPTDQPLDLIVTETGIITA